MEESNINYRTEPEWEKKEREKRHRRCQEWRLRNKQNIGSGQKKLEMSVVLGICRSTVT